MKGLFMIYFYVLILGSFSIRKNDRMRLWNNCTLYLVTHASHVNLSWQVPSLNIIKESILFLLQSLKSYLDVNYQIKKSTLKLWVQIWRSWRKPMWRSTTHWAPLIRCYKFTVLITRVSSMMSCERWKTAISR